MGLHKSKQIKWILEETQDVFEETPPTEWQVGCARCAYIFT